MKSRVATIGILVNILLATVKILAGIVSNSAAILAEGVHSFGDIISSAIGLWGIRASHKPADQQHPYGYFKYEVLAGIVITIILFITGLGMIFNAYSGWKNPTKIELTSLSFIVMLFSAVVNEIMARYKISVGKNENSLALLSDGYHSRVDVFTSLAVFAGLFLNRIWIYSDALMASLIGLYIVKESFVLEREAMDSLLDVSAGPEIENQIKEIVKDQSIDLLSLKTQKKGTAIIANLEISLDSQTSVAKADIISSGLRKLLIEKIERLRYISIQLKSHDIGTSYYKPAMGHGFGWQRYLNPKLKKGFLQESAFIGECRYCKLNCVNLPKIVKYF